MTPQKKTRSYGTVFTKEILNGKLSFLCTISKNEYPYLSLPLTLALQNPTATNKQILAFFRKELKNLSFHNKSHKPVSCKEHTSGPIFLSALFLNSKTVHIWQKSNSRRLPSPFMVHLSFLKFFILHFISSLIHKIDQLHLLRSMHIF